MSKVKQLLTEVSIGLSFSHVSTTKGGVCWGLDAQYPYGELRAHNEF